MSQAIYLDVKSASVSSSSNSKLITFTMPSPSDILIKDLSLNPDSTFAGSGTFQIFIGGQSVILTPKKLPVALDFPLWTFNEGKGLRLNPGDTIEIWGANSSGTGILTAEVLGEML